MVILVRDGNPSYSLAIFKLLLNLQHFGLAGNEAKVYLEMTGEDRWAYAAWHKLSPIFPQCCENY